MYLSRLLLDPRSREVRRDLAECHELHRTIMNAFPQSEEQGEGARERFGVLHRLETERQSNRLCLYVQSREKPDWGKLPAGYCLEAGTKRVEEIYRGLAGGSVLAFRLRANPSKRLSESRTGADGKPRLGRRVDLRREEDQIAWLRRKGEQGGFEVMGVRVQGVEKEEGQRRGGGRRGSGLTLAAVIFEGHLRITAAEKFYEVSLARGIGPGKAYGMGLLSLAPVNGKR